MTDPFCDSVTPIPSDSERQLWFLLRSGMYKVLALDSEDTCEIFMGELRGSSPGPYLGNISEGVIDPSVIDLFRSMNIFEREYFCSIISWRYKVGEYMAAIKKLYMIGVGWECIVDSSHPDSWIEATLKGCLSTRKGATNFAMLENAFFKTPAKFEGACSTLFEICNKEKAKSAKKTFTTGVKSAIERGDFREALVNKSISTKDELDAWISSKPKRCKKV